MFSALYHDKIAGYQVKWITLHVANPCSTCHPIHKLYWYTRHSHRTTRQHRYYLKWLRYYLDFCHKYHFKQGTDKSLFAFLKKLNQKNQPAQLKKQLPFVGKNNEQRRYHVHESLLQKALRTAVKKGREKLNIWNNACLQNLTKDEARNIHAAFNMLQNHILTYKN